MHIITSPLKEHTCMKVGMCLLYILNPLIYIYSWIKWHKHEIYEYIRGLHATEISGGDHITQNE